VEECSGLVSIDEEFADRSRKGIEVVRFVLRDTKVP
jgi:hypothetical protein